MNWINLDKTDYNVEISLFSVQVFMQAGIQKLQIEATINHLSRVLDIQMLKTISAAAFVE